MASFRKLAENLGRLTQVPSQVSAEVAEKISVLIDEQFAAGKDAYGQAWKPLKPATIAKGRRPPPLTDSGAMRGAITVKPSSGAGIEISSPTDYARFHQTGTKYMVPREVLPDHANLPPSWQKAIEESFRNKMKNR